jgi:hypothetical protein
MKTTLRRSLVAGLALGPVCLAAGQDKSRAASTLQRDIRPPAQAPMKTIKASGPFDVKMTPASAADAAAGRFALDKKYHGDLEGSAQGEMLTAMTAVKGSAAYVAIEKVTGRLAGRTGSFHLQHTGVMTRGTPSLTISVVPDSGTGELTGLTGTMAIQIAADGAHYYTFDYQLPGRP